MPREKSPATQGFDPGTFQLVAQCLNHYATPGPVIRRRIRKSRIMKTISLPYLFRLGLACVFHPLNQAGYKLTLSQPLVAPQVVVSRDCNCETSAAVGVSYMTLVHVTNTSEPDSMQNSPETNYSQAKSVCLAILWNTVNSMHFCTWW